MIIIVIGQSGSGKTTFCKREYLKEPYTIEQDITAYTVCGNNIYAIGKYGIGIRTEGTDTLPYNAQRKILEQIIKLSETGADVLIEGDRITSRAVFEQLQKLKTECKLYLVTCSIATSKKRLEKAGSKITTTFIKTTKTKARRLYLDYKEVFNGKIINTEEKKWKQKT